jgi:hypothetical protein
VDGHYESSTVYYQVSTVRLKNTPATAGDQLVLPNVDSLTLSFHFYYPGEEGLKRHMHDLETAIFHLAVEPLDSLGFEIRLTSIVGLAHHRKNILRLRRSDWMAFPPVILVEEGKHGSCPDRDGDGQYTPGYDVNHRVRDAWGLRDVLGYGRLTARFDASQARLRTESSRLPACRSTAHKPCYELISAHTTAPCTKGERGTICLPVLELEGGRYLRALDLGSRMKELGFGLPPREESTTFLRKLGDFFGVEDWTLLVTFNYESGARIGFTLLQPELLVPFLWDWAGTRITLGMDRGQAGASVDYIFSPSRELWVDWYGVIGLDLFGTTTAAAEAGVQLRHRLWKLPLGLRLGVRSNVRAGLALRRTRVTLEAGVVFH